MCSYMKCLFLTECCLRRGPRRDIIKSEPCDGVWRAYSKHSTILLMSALWVLRGLHECKTNNAVRMTLLMPDQQDRHELCKCTPLYALIINFISLHIPRTWGLQFGFLFIILYLKRVTFICVNSFDFIPPVLLLCRLPTQVTRTKWSAYSFKDAIFHTVILKVSESGTIPFYSRWLQLTKTELTCNMWYCYWFKYLRNALRTHYVLSEKLSCLSKTTDAVFW
jgi:hypothetical protein